jgi:predicted outer membrane repeat protein
MDDVRGGSFKTEPGTGIVNIVSCTFEKNFAFTGGAVYVRNNFTNIVDSAFINNTSTVSGSYCPLQHLFLRMFHSQSVCTIHSVSWSLGTRKYSRYPTSSTRMIYNRENQHDSSTFVTDREAQ